MTRMCIRLARELSDQLQAEARKQSEASGKTVTVSDLARECFREKLPLVSQRSGRENAHLAELREEVARLGERVENLTQQVEVLVEKLIEEFQEISTREQFCNLQKTLAKVLEANRR